METRGPRGGFYSKGKQEDDDDPLDDDAEPAGRKSIGKDLVNFFKKKFKSNAKERESLKTNRKEKKSTLKRMKNAQISYDKDHESNQAEGKSSIASSSQRNESRQGSMYTKFILFKDDDNADLRATEPAKEERKDDG